MTKLGRKYKLSNNIISISMMSLFFITACAEHGFKKNQGSTQLVVTDPTIQEQADKYPEQEISIKMGTEKIILAKMKFTNPLGEYDEQNNVMTLESDIELDHHKIHAKISGKIINGFAEMYPPEGFDGSLIDFRGFVTCLNVTTDGKLNCDKAVLDLYAKYKDQFYNEQFELNQVDKKFQFSKADQKLEEVINKKPSDQPQVSTSTHNNNTIPTPQPNGTTSTGADKKDPTADPNQTTTTTDTKEPVKNDNPQASEDNHEGSSNETNIENEADKKLGRYVGILIDIVEKFKQKKANEGESPVKEIESKAKEQNRPYNQSFGTPQEGKIANSTSMKSALSNVPNFLQLDTKMQFANYDMALTAKAIAEKINTLVPNYTLVVRDSSLVAGGENGHESHENGLDLDIGYLHKTQMDKFEPITSKNKLIPNKIYLNETWELFKFILSQPLADRIFVSPALKNEMCKIAKTQSGNFDNVLKRLRADHQNLHENHFHLRLKCPPLNPGCRNFGSDDIPVDCSE